MAVNPTPTGKNPALVRMPVLPGLSRNSPVICGIHSAWQRRFVLRRGVSLVEVMVSIVILAVVVLGAAAFFSTSRKTIERAAEQRTATQIASDRLEQARATGYATVDDDSGTVDVGDTSYSWTLTVTTALADSTDAESAYKQLEVAVNWATSGGDPVVIRSAIAP